MASIKLLGLFASVLTVVAAGPYEVALNQDDECPARREGEGCALNALQLSGRRDVSKKVKLTLEEELDLEEEDDQELVVAGPKRKCVMEGSIKIAACPKKQLKDFTDEDVKATCASSCRDKLVPLMKSCGMAEHLLDNKFCADVAATSAVIMKRRARREKRKARRVKRKVRRAKRKARRQMRKCYNEGFVNATGCPQKKFKEFIEDDVKITCASTCRDKLGPLMKSCGIGDMAEHFLDNEFCSDVAATSAVIKKRHERREHREKKQAKRKCARKALKAVMKSGKCPQHIGRILRTNSSKTDITLACSDDCKDGLVKAAEGCGAKKRAQKIAKNIAGRCAPASILQESEDTEDEDLQTVLEDEEEYQEEETQEDESQDGEDDEKEDEAIDLLMDSAEEE